ncbi:hypothetical protein ABLE91_05625 [Aquabacter sp. CN5-332]|uniref:hypothetical protein n=1 Tax=Aquabacter sp. CN5-332 TaxID=3156608 RepID=UPI0032B5F44E
MKLLDYMRDQKLDDEAMASLVGGITSHGIRKLKYGERNASLEVAMRIEGATGGLVRPSDLVKPSRASASHHPEGMVA